MNLCHLFLNARHKYRDNIAIIDNQTHTTVTFNDIFCHFSHMAHFFEQHNIVPGSKIALLSDPDSAGLLLDYAVMVTGRTKIPLDNTLSPTEIKAQIADSGATILFYSEKYRETALQLPRDKLLCLPVPPLFVEPVEDFSPDNVTPEQLLSLNYTGGSTGLPKAVMHTHHSFVSILSNMVIARDIQPGDKFLNVRPLWPIASVVVLAHLLAGGTLILEDRFRAESFLSLLIKYQIAYSSLVPTQLARLLTRHPEAKPLSLDTLKCIDIGASAVPAEVLDWALSLFKRRLAILYGMTEAPWSSYLRYQEIPALSGDVLSGLIGPPVFSAALKIDQPDSAGVGEILISGSHLMAGYWKNEVLTREVLQGSWLRTGDLGKSVGSGYIRIVGRIKEIIRSGGKSVLPKEVENCILNWPGIAEAHVFGRPDNEWGEKICAAIVLSVSPETFRIEELKAFCKANLSGFKVPKTFYIVDTLPRSHYGKIKSAQVVEMTAGL